MIDRGPIHVILLSRADRDLVRRPVAGRGGYQSLLRRIQRGLRGRELHVAEADLDALVRAVSAPRQGGFQQRAAAIVRGPSRRRRRA